MTRIFNRASEKAKRRKLRNEMTPAEKRLWLELRASQFQRMRWRRQYSIGPYVLNFYCPAAELGVELDGDSHFGDGAEARDAERRAYIEAMGIRVIRFLNQEVYHNMAMLLQRIAEFTPAVNLRGANPLDKQEKRTTPLDPPLLRGEEEENP